MFLIIHCDCKSHLPKARFPDFFLPKQSHIKKKVVTYNHKADQSKQDKYNFEYKLKKVDEALLPDYLIENRDKLNKWFD